jgi:opacity protein-like surface antigen
MNRIIYLLAILFLLSIQSPAQVGGNVANVATTAAPFLEIGVGARAIGMGGAFVATANDVSALYWNPSGIARQSRPAIIFVHTNWIADVAFDYAGAVIPLGRIGTVGASITSLSMDDMLVRTIDQPEGTGEYFQVNDMAIAVSYGFNLTERFSIGFTGKYIHQKIWKETAQGMAVDIGTLFTTGFNNMRIGAALTNFGSDVQMTGDDLLVYHDPDPYQMGNNDRIFAQLQTQKWPLPLNFQAGLAMEMFQTNSNRLTIATEAMHPINNTESMHLGMEYAFKELFFLRGGYRNLFLRDSEEGFTLGAGFSTRFMHNFQVTLDYAYADFGRLENAQRFSVSLGF